MIMMVSTYLRRWRRMLQRLTAASSMQKLLQMAGTALMGFCLSAASLGNAPQPFCMAVLCAGLPGWQPLVYALGGVVGYWLFWGNAGLQGIAWIAAAMPVCVMLGQKKASSQNELLQPAMAALILATSGVLFQLWQGDDTPIVMYVLRVGLAFGSTWLVRFDRQNRETAADWVLMAIGVLALAQIAPVSWLNIGIVAGAVIVAVSPFPAVALAGLALDLAQICPVPMTAVLCAASLLRLLPWLPKGWNYALPALMYVLVMAVCGEISLLPLPALFAGGILGTVIPRQRLLQRRGETGFAQVRLEMVAEVMAQSEHLLQSEAPHPLDENALIEKAADRACGTCPCRKGCKELEKAKQLPAALLHRPLISVDDVPVDCKKRGRLMLELRRGQDQYRILKADRDRQEEYRSAVIQQYRFLSEYLQEVADCLPQRGTGGVRRYQPEVAVCSSGKEIANGDRCMWFAGTENRYYLLLCDGMGTGTGAAEEARIACDMLRQLLAAGFPAAYALRSLNSLCTLRGRAGAVTLDLAEIRLDNGKVNIYKWGAAPSWLLLSTGAERIGTFGPPPGISVADARETVDKLSLRRGETLVMVSDGVNAGAICTNAIALLEEPTGSLAARILELGCQEEADDATAAVIRLTPIHISE